MGELKRLLERARGRWESNINLDPKRNTKACAVLMRLGIRSRGALL